MFVSHFRLLCFIFYFRAFIFWHSNLIYVFYNNLTQIWSHYYRGIIGSCDSNERTFTYNDNISVAVTIYVNQSSNQTNKYYDILVKLF